MLGVLRRRSGSESLRAARALVLTVAFATCGGDTTEPPPATLRGIQIVAGASLTDSVGALLRQPLIVEVHDSSGALAPLGTVVRFEGVAIPNDRGHEAFVQSLSSGGIDVSATGTTDGAGRTGVMVQLGFVAGPARIAISVPALGLRDTARYTATPGAVRRVTLSPSDTGVYAGRSYALRGVVTDQFGNARNDPIVWSTLSTGISLTSAGVITAVQIGRHSVTATAATRSATGFVSVVPPATITAWTGSRIVAVDLDGSNLRDLAAASAGDISAQPRWIPGTNNIVFAHWDGIAQYLQIVDDAGAVRRFFPTPPADVLHQAEPEPSANGQWLYFSAQDTRCAQYVYCLHRARIDGSSPELLGNFITPNIVTWRPAPSPDGARVAFVTDDGGAVIKVFDVVSRTVSSWKVQGQNPSWSPTGGAILFIRREGPLMLMNPDGSGVRRLTEQLYSEQPLAWSRDGRWVLAARPTALDLIDVNTGEVLPLSHLRGLSAPSFK